MMRSIQAGIEICDIVLAGAGVFSERQAEPKYYCWTWYFLTTPIYRRTILSSALAAWRAAGRASRATSSEGLPGGCLTLNHHERCLRCRLMSLSHQSTLRQSCTTSCAALKNLFATWMNRHRAWIPIMASMSHARYRSKTPASAKRSSRSTGTAFALVHAATRVNECYSPDEVKTSIILRLSAC